MPVLLKPWRPKIWIKKSVQIKENLEIPDRTSQQKAIKYFYYSAHRLL